MSHNSWFLRLKVSSLSLKQPRLTGTAQLCRAARDKDYSLSQPERKYWMDRNSVIFIFRPEVFKGKHGSVRNLGLYMCLCDMCLELLSLRPHCLGILNAMGWGEHIVQLWPVWQRSRRSDHWGAGPSFFDVGLLTGDVACLLWVSWEVPLLPAAGCCLGAPVGEGRFHAVKEGMVSLAARSFAPRWSGNRAAEKRTAGAIIAIPWNCPCTDHRLHLLISF